MKWYKYDIRDLTDAEYNRWYSLMSDDKQQRVDRFRFEDDRKRTVAGEMLARKAIAEWCGVTTESITFGKQEHGKPYVEGLAVEFNISHSGNIVVCAVDDKPVGIDIEKIRPINLSVTKHICTDDEICYLFGHAPTEQNFRYITDIEILARFFELWTKKEAYGKCVGVGVSYEVDESNYNIKTFFDIEKYIVTICTSNKKQLQLSIHSFD